jgi:hypothetical protein
MPVIIKYHINIPSGLSVLGQTLSTEIKEKFAILREYSTSNGAKIESNATNGLDRYEVITWPTREALDEFLEFANSLGDYDALYKAYTDHVESIDGTVTRVEEEI